MRITDGFRRSRRGVILGMRPHGERSWGYMAAGFLLAVGATWL